MTSNGYDDYTIIGGRETLGIAVDCRIRGWAVAIADQVHVFSSENIFVLSTSHNYLAPDNAIYSSPSESTTERNY